jgi:hypothetical protein
MIRGSTKPRVYPGTHPFDTRVGGVPAGPESAKRLGLRRTETD